MAGWDKEVGPSVYNIPLGGGLFRQPWAIGGTTTFPYPELTLTRGVIIRFRLYLCLWLLRRYVPGGLGQRRSHQFRQEQYATLPPLPFIKFSIFAALSLAMARDGSSGGVIRMCVITEEGVERQFIPGDQLPKFWEGCEVLPTPVRKTKTTDPVPMAVE